MTKSLYYIECTCVKDCKFPNVEFHVGDVIYFNSNSSTNEMYVWNPYINPGALIIQSATKYSHIGGSISYMPFTRQKRFAKKWKIKRYPEHIVNIINGYGEFNAVIKEIKITYTEEEV